MKRARMTVPWRCGLHLRPAASLVRVAREFRSTILIRCGDRVSDLRSILGIIALCATLGTTVDIEVNGDDEQAATDAVERVFSAADQGDSVDAPVHRAP